MKITTLNSLNLNRSEESSSEVSSSLETPATVNSEKITNKGEARYQAISTFISGAGKKVSGWLKRGGELFKAGAVGVLSAPEAVAAGTRLVGAKVEEGAAFLGEKADQADEWIEGRVGAVYEFGANQYREAKNFLGTKAEQAGDYMKDKALLAEAVLSLGKEKTVEQLGKARDGVINTYGKAVEYGKRAVDSASLRGQQIKEGYNKKKNVFMEMILQRKAEIQAERLQKTLAKLAQYRMVEGLGDSVAV